MTSAPEGCVGGSPVLSQGCNSVDSWSIGLNGLKWSPSFGILSWYDGSSTCTSFGGRLPTWTEIINAMNNQFINGGITPGGFIASIYWSSTLHTYDRVYWVICDGDAAYALYGGKTQGYTIRCVY